MTRHRSRTFYLLNRSSWYASVMFSVSPVVATCPATPFDFGNLKMQKMKREKRPTLCHKITKLRFMSSFAISRKCRSFFKKITLYLLSMISLKGIIKEGGGTGE